MKKKLVLIALVTLTTLPLAGFAGAFEVDPFHFGRGCLATWERDAGEPGQKGDLKQFGLYLQKHTASADFAAAGVRNMLILPIPAASLNTLAFDISGFPGADFGGANGYCGAGSPRFNVVSGAGTCFLGCVHGTKTQDTQTGWWEIRFDTPFNAFPGCESGVTGNVTSISIVFDEGTDVGPGNVVIDNIRINNEVVGVPRGGG